MSKPAKQERIFHEICAAFPMMPREQLDALVDDIRQNGVREPIIVDSKGIIIDGRHRYMACKKLGIKVPKRTWNGKGKLLDLVLSLNVHRRHLDESQRAMVAAKLVTTMHGGDRRSDQAANLPVVPQAEAAEKLRVSERTVRSARRVLSEGVPELVAAVESGQVAVSAAAEIAKLPADQQKPELVRDRKSNAREVMHSSESSEWYSPAELVEPARTVMGSIDLDPASSAEANQLIRAAKIYTAEDDGLLQPWFGNVWLNPPGGVDEDQKSITGKFVARLIEQYRAGAVQQAVLECFRVPHGDAWFWPLWDFPLCFLRGRIKHRRPGGEVGEQPSHCSAVAYLGKNVAGFARAYGQLGRIVVPQGGASITLESKS